MSLNLTIQYVLVIVALVLSLAWILHKLFSKKNRASGKCCGCAFSNSCNSSKKRNSGSDCCENRDTNSKSGL